MKREERSKERKQRQPAYRAMDCSSIADETAGGGKMLRNLIIRLF